MMKLSNPAARITVMAAVLLSAAFLVPQGLEAKKGAPSKDPFNATFRDFGVLDPPPPLDRITSDGFGTYIDGQDGVVARFPEGTGSFVIDPDRNAGKKDVRRFFNLDLTQPLDDPGDFVLGTYQSGFMSVRGSGGVNAVGKACSVFAVGDTPTDAPARDMKEGECTWARVAVNFPSDSHSGGFRLRCGRFPNLNQGGTDEILVTCDDSLGDACTTWTIRPSVDGVLACRLYEDIKNKTNTVADFNMPFGFQAVRQ